MFDHSYRKKVKNIDLYSASSQAASNALSSLTRAASQPGHRPQPAQTVVVVLNLFPGTECGCNPHNLVQELA